MIGPVELYLFPFIGNSINSFFITPLTDEISLVIVTAKEVI